MKPLSQFIKPLYPRKPEYGRANFPSWNNFRFPHATFSEIERLSSCAKEAISVKINSPFESSVQIFSFSNITPMPSSFSFQSTFNESRVFLANLDTDFVRIISILPDSQSSSIRVNPGLCFDDKPLIPSSAYTPASIHSALSFMTF